MTARIKTSQRIVETSLEMFNQLGERSVSTNHIAAQMEISPGNLYYHFPNKQAIIAVLFADFEALVLGFLHPPQGRRVNVADIRYYLQHLLGAMWRYRFIYRDIEHLLRSDIDLAASYRRFSLACLIQAQAIYSDFVEAGILRMSPQQVESLAINAWIILTSWVSFLCATREDSSSLSEQALKRGVYQVLELSSAFTTEHARAEVDELIKDLYVPLNQTLDGY